MEVQTPFTAEQTVSTPGPQVVISLASSLDVNSRYTVTINQLDSDLHDFSDNTILLSGRRSREFTTNAAPLLINDVSHGDDFVNFTITFSRDIDPTSVSNASQFQMEWRLQSNQAGPPTTRSATSATASGRQVTITMPVVVPHNTSVTLRVLHRTSGGVRDTLMPTPTYLVTTTDPYEFEFETDPVPPFAVAEEVTYENNRVNIVFTNPVNVYTIHQVVNDLNSTILVYNNDTGVRIPMHQRDRMMVNENDTLFSWAPRDPLALGATYRVEIADSLRDIHGQSLPAGTIKTFVTRVLFRMVDGTVSTETLRSGGFVVRVRFNRSINLSTVEGNVTIQKSTGRAQTITPTQFGLAGENNDVLVIYLQHPLSSASTWRINVTSGVTDTVGNTFNGVPVEFSVAAEFVMLTQPDYGGASRSVLEFTMSHRPANHAGVGTNRMVYGEHFRMAATWTNRVGGQRVEAETFPVRGRQERLYTQEPRLVGGVWKLQVNTYLRSCIDGVSPGSTPGLFLYIKDKMPGEDFHLFSGGARGGLVSSGRFSGWWEYNVGYPSTPRLEELTVTSVRAISSTVVIVEFSKDNLLRSSAEGAAYTVTQSPNPRVSISSSRIDPDDSGSVLLTLSRELRGGDSIIIQVPAGISTDEFALHERSVTRQRTYTVDSYTPPARSFRIRGKFFDASDDTANFLTTKPISTASQLTHIRVSSGLHVLRAYGTQSSTGGAVVIHLRSPILPGDHFVRLANTLTSTDGSYLDGSRENTTLNFTIEGTSGTWSRNTARDSFVVGSTYVVIGIDGDIPRTTGRSGVGGSATNPSLWSIPYAAYRTTGQRHPYFVRVAVRVTNVEVINNVGYRLTVSVAPVRNSQWRVTGPVVWNGNRREPVVVATLTT